MDLLGAILMLSNEHLSGMVGQGNQKHDNSKVIEAMSCHLRINHFNMPNGHDQDLPFEEELPIWDNRLLESEQQARLEAEIELLEAPESHEQRIYKLELEVRNLKHICIALSKELKRIHATEYKSVSTRLSEALDQNKA